MTRDQAAALKAQIKGYSNVRIVYDPLVDELNESGEKWGYYVVADGYRWTSPNQEYAERR